MVELAPTLPADHNMPLFTRVGTTEIIVGRLELPRTGDPTPELDLAAVGQLKRLLAGDFPQTG